MRGGATDYTDCTDFGASPLRNAGRLRDTREETERRCGYNGRCAPYAAIAFRPAAFAWHGSGGSVDRYVSGPRSFPFLKRRDAASPVGGVEAERIPLLHYRLPALKQRGAVDIADAV